MKENISGTTQLIALLGKPVSHSKSPAMQNGIFAELGLDYVYLAFEVNEHSIADAVKGLRAMQFRGANVTMPLKKIICKYLDKMTPAAQLAGAVNVIVNNNGVLTGHISDGEGYMLSLVDAGVEYIGKKLTILGAGGASTAVAIQAAMEGVKSISIFNRKGQTFADAEKLVFSLRENLACDAKIFDLSDTQRLHHEISESAILINGTSIGMKATEDQSLIPDTSFFHPGLVVSDLIYVPEETKLLQMARAAGNKTISGLGMQLFQGVSAFKMWTGQNMPVETARRILFETSLDSMSDISVKGLSHTCSQTSP